MVQYFSLTTNQRTILFNLSFQRNEQLTPDGDGQCMRPLDVQLQESMLASLDSCLADCLYPYKNGGILIVFVNSSKTLPLVIAYGNSHYDVFGRKNLY